MDPSLHIKLDGKQEGGRMNKEESGCAPAVCCHRPPAAVPASSSCATSGVGYLCLAIPSGGQYILQPSQHTHTLYCCHRQDSRSPGFLALPWFSPPTSLLSSLSGLPRVACRSHLCVIYPASSEIHGTSCLANDAQIKVLEPFL